MKKSKKSCKSKSLKVQKKKGCSVLDCLPPKKRNKLVRITLRVEPALKRELMKEAKKEGISFSAYCGEALIVSVMNAHL